MRERDSVVLPKHVREYLNLIVEKVEPKAIILTGSFARGEAHRFSDYDLLVISDDLPEDYWKRTDVLWSSKPFDVDVVGFMEKEVERKIHTGFVLDALLIGKVVYGDVDSLRKKAQRFVIDKNLVRSSAGYFKKVS